MSKKNILINIINNNNNDNLIDKLYPYINIFLDIRYFNKKEINNFNNIDLKYNCQKYSLNTIGTKSKLVNRLWGIVNPSEMPDDAYLKKRGRKKNKEEENKEIQIFNEKQQELNKYLYNPNKLEILKKIVNNNNSNKLIDMIFPFINIFIDITFFKKEEINKFNRKDLEYNCQKYSLKSNGSKEVLFNRLCGIINPSEMPDDAHLKKRGRKMHKTIEDNLDILIKNENEKQNRNNNHIFNDDMNNLYIIYSDIHYNIRRKKSSIYHIPLYISTNNNVYKLYDKTYIYNGTIKNNKIYF